MQRRTQVLIGLAVVALGIGAWALGLASGQSSVHRVEDVVAAPAQFDSGSHVLLGVPQPSEVPVSAQEGTVLRPNDQWSNTTSSTVHWTDAQGNGWYSTRTVTITAAADATHWSYRNETRRLPADPAPALPPVTMEWTTPATTRAFAIEAFHDATTDTPRIWGLYSGLLKDPMQPKPSQFTGHLLATLPDGRAVPDGAYLYDVQEYKAGCSSKFLPPEEKQRLQQSGQI
jgi:hypothetical protein